MDWITFVPLHLPGFPNLSWTVLFWLAFFALAAVFVSRLVWRYVHIYRAERDGGAEADRLLAVGDLIGHSLVLVVCLFGLAIGLTAAHTPQPRHPLTVSAFTYTLLFLGIAAGLAAKSVFLDYYHRRALHALRAERRQRLTGGAA